MSSVLTLICLRHHHLRQLVKFSAFFLISRFQLLMLHSQTFLFKHHLLVLAKHRKEMFYQLKLSDSTFSNKMEDRRTVLEETLTTSFHCTVLLYLHSPETFGATKIVTSTYS